MATTSEVTFLRSTALVVKAFQLQEMQCYLTGTRSERSLTIVWMA